MTPEVVPGNHPNGPAALLALTELSSMLLGARAGLLRLEQSANDLTRLISKLEADRKDAVRAVELFAEVAPSSFGIEPNAHVEHAVREVDARVLDLLRDAAAIVDNAGGL